LAESCREQCRLDRVWFVPAAIAPHKTQRKLASDRHRVEMLKLALAGHEAMSVCELEIERGGLSYTVDTLAEIARLQPEVQLFLVMGADSLHDLATWHEPRRICELALPVFVRRSGTAEVDLTALASLVSPERLEEIRATQVAMPLIELSSTDIRDRVAQGKSIRYRTPRAVEKYIETHGLYVGE
jgi:nicotinate-nucleotide adenylyltransferase